MPIEDLTIDLSFAGHTELGGSRTELLSSTRLSVRYAINLGHNFQLTPKINFQKRLGYTEEDGGLTRDEVWGGLGVSWTF